MCYKFLLFKNVIRSNKLPQLCRVKEGHAHTSMITGFSIQELTSEGNDLYTCT